MRALIFAFVAAAFAAPIAALPASESHVWVQNSTDKWVWVTAFTHMCKHPNAPTPASAECTYRHIVHEWCVPPAGEQRTISKQGFHLELSVVHLLVTAHPNCGRPILKEWVFDYHIYYGRFSMIHQYNVTMDTKNGVASYEAADIDKP